MITEIIDATGDGHRPLDSPWGVVTNGLGDAYLTGYSDNGFKIAFSVFADGFESNDTSA